MALGIVSESNQNIVKIDCKARVIKVRREGVDGEQEYEWGAFKAIFDMPNIMVGYVRFGPFVTKLVRHGEIAEGKAAMPDRPDNSTDENGRMAWRSGFSLHVKLGKSIGGGAFDLTSSTGLLCQAMDALHDDFLAAPQHNEGKLPVVVIKAHEAIKTQGGTNYKPILAIDSWAPRPADLVAVAVQPAAASSNGAAAGSDFEDDVPFDAPKKTEAKPVAVETEF